MISVPLYFLCEPRGVTRFVPCPMFFFSRPNATPRRAPIIHAQSVSHAKVPIALAVMRGVEKYKVGETKSES
jgi:hypothetical protein